MGKGSFVAVMLAVLVLTGCDRKPEAAKKAGSATIIVVGKQGVSKTYLISDKDKMAALEQFFPNYQNRPTSNTAAGWKAGYFVYFDFPHGESIKLVVSPTNLTEMLWTMGRGDHKVVGDFGKFMSDLPE